MREYTARSFGEFHEIVKSYDAMYAIFRGQSDSSFGLTPSIQRLKPSKMSVRKAEVHVFNQFKQRAISFLDRPPSNDWEWIALAQHHGLATRLLDWTRNPMIAAFFALNGCHNTDCAVWVIPGKQKLIQGAALESVNPFKIKEVHRFVPNHVTNRIIAQAGLFTIHPAPFNQFNVGNKLVEKSLEKIIIPKNVADTFQREIYVYGAHRQALFPDLDGLAKHLIWMRYKTTDPRT
jgi:FRG domain